MFWLKYFVAVLFLIPNHLKAQNSEGFMPFDAYLDVEENAPLISVFNKPGLNWKYCEKNNKGECKDAVGWLDSKPDKLRVIGDIVKAKTIDPFTGKEFVQDYYEVEFDYTRDTYVQQGRGYVEASYIRRKKLNTVFGTKDLKFNKETSSCSSKNNNNLSNIKEQCEVASRVSLNVAAEKIHKLVGMCPLEKPTQPPVVAGKKNVYDQLVLPELLKVKLPAIKTESEKQMTREDLIAIDSLSRTLYGEMASCFREGLHYPMAIARIAINRAEEKKRESEFIRGKHEEAKPPLSRVLTSPTQFSMWLKQDKGKPNRPLNMGLCPPKEQAKAYHGGKSPSKNETYVWENAVKIATEAVMYPERFKKRTDSLKNLYHYTSGMGQFYRMTQVRPSIEGRSLSLDRCMELWKDRKNSFDFIFDTDNQIVRL